jgi:hypothetical protein
MGLHKKDNKNTGDNLANRPYNLATHENELRVAGHLSLGLEIAGKEL